MPELLENSDVFLEGIVGPFSAAIPRLPSPAHYGLSLLLVAIATILACAAQRLSPVSSLTLIFVLPVVITASISGWGPSLLAVGAGATAFDFFFTQP